MTIVGNQYGEVMSALTSGGAHSARETVGTIDHANKVASIEEWNMRNGLSGPRAKVDSFKPIEHVPVGCYGCSPTEPVHVFKTTTPTTNGPVPLGAYGNTTVEILENAKRAETSLFQKFLAFFGIKNVSGAQCTTLLGSLFSIWSTLTSGDEGSVLGKGFSLGVDALGIAAIWNPALLLPVACLYAARGVNSLLHGHTFAGGIELACAGLPMVLAPVKLWNAISSGHLACNKIFPYMVKQGFGKVGLNQWRATCNFFKELFTNPIKLLGTAWYKITNGFNMVRHEAANYGTNLAARAGETISGTATNAASNVFYAVSGI